MEEEQQTTPPALPAKRVLACSTRGDLVWTLMQPVLEHFIDNGDEELRAKALKARAYWEQAQQPFIDWGNRNHFFSMAERACQDIRQFRRLLETLPAESTMQVDYYLDGVEEPRKVDLVAYLALQAGERFRKRTKFRK